MWGIVFKKAMLHYTKPCLFLHCLYIKRKPYLRLYSRCCFPIDNGIRKEYTLHRFFLFEIEYFNKIPHRKNQVTFIPLMTFFNNNPIFRFKTKKLFYLAISLTCWWISMFLEWYSKFYCAHLQYAEVSW